MNTDGPTTSYGEVQQKLQDVATAMANRARRELHGELAAHHGLLPGIVATWIEVSRATFEAGMHLCIDSRIDALDYFIAVPPLTRTLVDTLFTVVFVFERPGERIAWYVEDGYNDIVRQHERMQDRYGDDPRWADFLKGQGAWVDLHRADLDEAALARPDRQRRWPTPGRMLGDLGRDRSPFSDQDRRELLTHLKDWYYGALSGDSHLTYMGMTRRGGALHYGRDLYRQVVVRAHVAIHLALLSQFAIELRLAYQASRLIEVWDHFQTHEEIADMFERLASKLRAVADRGEGG